MALNQEILADITIFKPSGRLDTAACMTLESAVLDRLRAGCTRLVFDLSAVDYISSAGLRVVLVAGKKLQSVQGKLVLCGLRPEVYGVFDMSGFLKLFDCLPNLQEALAAHNSTRPRG